MEEVGVLVTYHRFPGTVIIFQTEVIIQVSITKVTSPVFPNLKWQVSQLENESFHEGNNNKYIHIASRK